MIRDACGLIAGLKTLSLYIDTDHQLCIDIVNDINSFSMDNVSEEELGKIRSACIELLSENDSFEFKNYIYSFENMVFHEYQLMIDWISYLLDSDADFEVLYQCYNIISSLSFHHHSEYSSSDFLILTTKLLRHTVEVVQSELPASLFVPIPKEKRNNDKVLVITRQLLTVMHGPSKHALDHCAALVKYMKKNVTLINTAELGGQIIAFCIIRLDLIILMNTKAAIY